MSSRRYRVTAEGLFGRYDAGLVGANTKRAAIRQGQRRYREAAKQHGWEKPVSDFYWAAQYEPEPAGASEGELAPEDVSAHR